MYLGEFQNEKKYIINEDSCLYIGNDDVFCNGMWQKRRQEEIVRCKARGTKEKGRGKGIANYYK